MAQVQLSKSSLTREKENLALPALLAGARSQAPATDGRAAAGTAEDRAARARVARVIEAAGEAIPMMTDRRVSLDGLVRLGEGIRLARRTSPA
ncbi:MAG: hypothetical protein R3C69_12550 [Geminicoccaceae bacterium]